MADLGITAGNVLAGATATVVSGTSGGTITAGMACYYNATTKKWYPAQNDTAAHCDASGVSLNNASASQPVRIATAGPVTIGAVVAVGATYYVGAGAGGISADVPAMGEFNTHVGIATTAAIITVKFNASGVAAAA
jgi:hypothetical protein